MYVADTSWGFGVFKYGTLLREFTTYDEAYSYLNYLKEGKESD